PATEATANHLTAFLPQSTSSLKIGLQDTATTIECQIADRGMVIKPLITVASHFQLQLGRAQLSILQLQLELIDLHLSLQPRRAWILRLEHVVGGEPVELRLKFLSGEMSGILIHGRPSLGSSPSFDSGSTPALRRKHSKIRFHQFCGTTFGSDQTCNRVNYAC